MTLCQFGQLRMGHVKFPQELTQMSGGRLGTNRIAEGSNEVDAVGILVGHDGVPAIVAMNGIDQDCGLGEKYFGCCRREDQDR